jgi:hypothetical protein
VLGAGLDGAALGAALDGAALDGTGLGEVVGVDVPHAATSIDTTTRAAIAPVERGRRRSSIRRSSHIPAEGSSGPKVLPE